ncbi:MAG: cellulase family glycosylhydrolase [Saprospiraceae bacterium]|nr:cellulase family glycosylhydrolase [Saprospiraceae bacterium]
MRTLWFFGLALCVNYLFAQLSIKNSQFYLGNRQFAPLILNYDISIRHEEGGIYYPSPAMSYYTTPSIETNCLDSTECYEHLLRDFKLIKSLGFNCIRLVSFEFGISPFGQEQEEASTTDISYYYGPIKVHFFKNPYEDHFRILDKILKAAQSHELKVILVSGGKKVHLFPYSQDYNNYLQFLAHRYSNDTTLIAFDLLNEPAYFHNLDSKLEIQWLVNQWCASIRHNTNNQLITIGLTDAFTSFDWDTDLLNVDFFSFHLYPDKDGTINNYIKQLQWFSKNIKKPWIIGETGFASSSFQTNKKNNGNQDEQAKFAEETYKLCMDCGGIAYSWWQYHDVSWSADYGLVDSVHQVKKVGKLFSSLQQYVPNPEACRNLNLRSVESSARKKKIYSSSIVNVRNEAIQNAVVRGSLGKGRYLFAVVDEHGVFTMESDKRLKRLRLSAPGFRTISIGSCLKRKKFQLKRIELNSFDELDWMESTTKEYCKVKMKRIEDQCKKNCESDKECIRYCRKEYKNALRDCRNFLLKTKI